MDRPLVSIITPCYNGEAYLQRYFDSILKQTYPNLELIFINDGSADKTEEIALSYREQLESRGIEYTYLYQENAGQAAALNKGLKLFKGDYLTWPDSDDVMTPDCIEKKVAFLECHPELDMVRSNGYFYNPVTQNKYEIAAEADKYTQDIFEKLLLVHTYGCCGCYMIKTKLFLQCYPNRDFYESRAGQNWQMLVPSASRSQCGYIDEFLYYVYETHNSHSRNSTNALNKYERWESFTDVCLHALEASECDKCKYVNLLKENCARQKFYIAISRKDKEVIKSTMADINKFGKATLKEKLLYIKYLLK